MAATSLVLRAEDWSDRMESCERKEEIREVVGLSGEWEAMISSAVGGGGIVTSIGDGRRVELGSTV